eukprot:4445744-Pyramimonas_sp.AAC.1
MSLVLAGLLRDVAAVAMTTQAARELSAPHMKALRGMARDTALEEAQNLAAGRSGRRRCKLPSAASRC